MKKSLLLLICSIAFSSHGAIQLTWENTAGTLYNSNGSTPLFGTNAFDPYDSSLAFFVQLIKGAPQPIDLNSPTAVGVGNVLIDSEFMGSGIFFDPGSGRISVTETYNDLNTNDVVFIRLWNAASPNFASGLAPIPLNSGSATHYGDSQTFTILDGGTGIASFIIPSTSTITAVPEPTTIALMGISLATVIFGIRRRRYSI